MLRARRAQVVLWAAAAATLLNLHWPISMGEQSTLLESGYFIWVSSFALLALAAFLVVRPQPSLSQIAALRAAGRTPAGGVDAPDDFVVISLPYHTWEVRFMAAPQ